MTDDVVDSLARVAATLPRGGETRVGQRDMAVAVARSIEDQRHLVVQAGTGTGKSLAYLISGGAVGRAGGGGHRHQGTAGSAGHE